MQLNSAWSIPNAQLYDYLPCDIIGSIVNVCPDFITPTALFSNT